MNMCLEIKMQQNCSKKRSNSNCQNFKWSFHHPGKKERYNPSKMIYHQVQQIVKVAEFVEKPTNAVFGWDVDRKTQSPKKKPVAIGGALMVPGSLL